MTDGPGSTDAGVGCTLCELPLPDPPIRDPDVLGTFCCHGCLEVARSLGDRPVDGSTVDVRERVREHVAADRNGITDPDAASGAATAFLTIDGMHCSTCEVFLEERTRRLDGVHEAAASYASDLLRVSYDPDHLEESTLIEEVSGTGYTARPRAPSGGPADAAPDVTITRFLIGGGLFGMMVMLWYVLFLYPTYFGIDPLFDLGGMAGRYLFVQIWLLTSIVLFYTGYPILRGGYVSLRARQPNMDLLVSIAALSAYGYSTVAMTLGRTDLYFDVAVAIVLVVTAGTYYEGLVKERAAGLLSDLTSMRSTTARRADGESVPLSAVESGDALIVRPGERIPVDGTVLEGAAAIDEALVTGESLPRTKRPGDPVRGGTIVMDHPVTVAAGDPVTSTVDRLVDLQWSIESARHGVQRLADKLSTIFVPTVIVLAIAGALGTLAMGARPVAALLVGLTVLIVSCPCALGIATPLAVASGVREAAARNIVIASDMFFEAAPSVDIVAIDKTGTLTEGEMTVEAVHGDDPEAVLTLAAAVERFSAHPVADAICRRAVDDRGAIRTDGGSTMDGSPQPLEEDRMGPVTTLDRGVEGRVGDAPVLVGHPTLFDDRGWTVDPTLRSEASAISDRDSIPVLVGKDHRAIGVVAVGDRPRTDWAAVVGSFAEAGYEVIVLTGDDSAAADRFRRSQHVDRVFAGVPPEGKAATIERLRSEGTTAMIGDGSNDAPALAAADVGIALESGTALATDAADAVIVGDALGATADVLRLAHATNRRIKQNLAWALTYNAIAIPVALAGLLNPLFAAVAMASSSILVVLNSSRRLL